ncbi:MAG: type II secretion system F family protein [Firmicutes bacterium]|nr:type II secretion system F family protein [Bacillota bacterium]
MEKLKLSYEEIGSLCAELALLIHSGTGSADALSVLSEDVENKALSERLKAMADEADMGTNLSDLFEKDDSFPKYLSTLLKVGEKTGHTEESLRSLSDYYYGQSRLSQQIRDALVYPSILLVVMLLVIGVLLVKVLPIFDEVYKQLGSGLSGVAGGLLSLGGALSKVMPLLAAVLLAAVVFILLFSSSEGFRSKVVLWWRKKHGGKGLSWEVSSAHFAQAFSMGLSSGMPTEEAIELAGKVLSDIPAAKERCDEAFDLVSSGTSLPDALAKTRLLPSSEARLLSTALKSGSGDRSIREISERLSFKGERSIRQAVSRVEPAIVIISCVLVGLILLCVMLPLMNIMAAIG